MPAPARSRFEALVDEALMRGVLVDDDDAVAGLRDDIGAVELRARRAERRGERSVVGSALAGASIGRGRRELGERRLAAVAVGEAAVRHVERRLPAARLAPMPGAARGARPRARPDARRRRLRPQGCQRARAARGRGAEAGAGERLLEGRDDEAAHEGRIAEAHLRLGRMHVDVDLARVAGRCASARTGWRSEGMTSA